MKEKVKEIVTLSSQFKALRSNDDEIEKSNVVDYLNRISDSDLLSFKASFENTNPEKVRKVRLLVVNHLLKEKRISINDIEKIKREEASKHEENIFHSWKSYFSLFLPLIYINKVDGLLIDIANNMVKDLGLENSCVFKIVDFSGANNFGADNAWIAIYNRNQPSQATSLQIFINFNGSEIQYGLYRYSSKTHESQTIRNFNSFDYKEMISELQKDKQKIIDDISFVKYWKFSPGEDAIYWDEMKRQKIAAIGWGNHNFSDATDKESVINIAPEFNGNQPGQKWPGIIYEFIRASRGDIICAFKGKNYCIGYGVIEDTSKYSENPVVGETYHNYIKVDWVEFNNPIYFEKKVSSNSFNDITKRDDVTSTIEKIRNKENDENIDYYETQKNMKLNQILYGPPGTGKTFNTINLAVQIASPEKFHALDNNNSVKNPNKAEFDNLRDKGQIEFITFHQNYSYEEFVVGIRPNTKNETLTFVKNEGIFYSICKKAEKNYLESKDNPSALLNFVLIIDEINRANISRVFGELITLLEDDKRMGAENELTVTLPNNEKFCIPPNLYLIGTMNTADKSIALIDIALRRRFSFIGMYPKYDLDLDDPSKMKFLRSINKKIYELKGSADFLIGHAYFMKNESLENIVIEKVIPLLMEYFNNKIEVVKEILSEYNWDYSIDTYKWKVNVPD